MLPFLKDPVKRGWTAMAVLAVVLLGLLVPLVWNADDRHLTAYGTGDEDASLARARIEGAASRVDAYLATPHPLDEISEPSKTLLVILGVERRYSESEADAILDFVRRGGNLLLADEGGYGTDIAAAAGFGFLSQNLVDTRNHLGDPTLVVSTARLDGRGYDLLFNQPTAVRPLSNANAYEAIARSSRAAFPDGSFIDQNENGEIDIGDTASDDAASFILALRTDLGEGSGTIVLIADTGVFMNAQVQVPDYQNEDFITDLVTSLIPRDGVVILDEGRHAPDASVAAYDNAVRTLGRMTSGVLAPLLTLALVGLATLGAWWSTRETEDWSHHAHRVDLEVQAPPDVIPDLGRAQRMARRRISERFNIPLEQVAAMPADELFTLTGDRLLSDAAAGTLRSDPAPLFRQFSEALP